MHADTRAKLLAVRECALRALVSTKEPAQQLIADHRLGFSLPARTHYFVAFGW